MNAVSLAKLLRLDPHSTSRSPRGLPVPRPTSSGPVEYTFKERARIAQAFFNPPQSAEPGGNLERRTAVVDDLVSLCTRQERRPRKPRRT